MPTESAQDIIEELSKLVLDTIMSAKPPEPSGRFASVESFQTLHGILIVLRKFLFAASNGDLSGKVTFKGYVAGTLKTLQANLRHLTWQTKRVASGDFTQRIAFMGEFSEAFNAMVIQLDRTMKELVDKESELSRANEDLLKEIAIRRQTESGLKKSKAVLKRLAQTDSLTGLYNRRHFNKLAVNEIKRVARFVRPLSVMILDLDFFKKVNDIFGHTSGDSALRMVAKSIQTGIRATDIPGRYGGEEFIVLLPETAASEAAVVAERLRSRIEATAVPTDKCRLTITASFGVSDCLGAMEGQSWGEILSEFVNGADLALYASKKGGRNRVTVYQPQPDHRPEDLCPIGYRC